MPDDETAPTSQTTEQPPAEAPDDSDVLLYDQTDPEVLKRRGAPDAPATKDPPRKMYIGPSIPGGGLGERSLWKGEGYPKHLESILEACPELKPLFVPTNKLGKALAELEAGTGRYKVLSDRVKEWILKGGKV